MLCMANVKKLKNEKGVTLTELLAAIVLAAIIGIIGYNILFSGFSTMERVKTEAALRDEADLIMASFIEELYTKKMPEIQFHHSEDGNYYFFSETNPEYRTGFIAGEPYVNDRKIMLRDDIGLSKDETTIEDLGGGRFRITISLKSLENDQTLETMSEIRLIVHSEEEEGEGNGEE